MKKLKLGAEVECVVTGFTGIVTHRLEYLDGSVDFGVTPKNSKSDGSYPKVEYIPSTRLKVVGPGVHVEPVDTSIGFRADGGRL